MPKKSGADRENASDFFYPQRSTVCTQTFSRFLRDYHESVDSFFFVVRLVANADRSRVIASKALIEVAKSEEVEELQKSANDPDAALRELKRFSSVQSRNLTNATVNGFQRYFSEIIHAATLKRPELLRSSETVRIDEVLRFKRHKDLVSFLIDKKTNELSYGGIRAMESYFRERLGVDMFATEEERALLTIFVELRNINVHNGGVVNEIFLQRAGKFEGFDFVRGKNFHVDMDKLVVLSDNAIRAALAIEKSVATKFGIQRKAHMHWLKPKSK